MKNRVVITGIGVVSPNAIGQQNYLTALKMGKSGIKFIPELAELEFGCCIGGIPEITDSKYFNHIELLGLEQATGIIKYALLAGLEAWTDAGFSIHEPGQGEVDYDTGIIIGSGIGPADIWGFRTVPLTNEKKIKRLRSTIVEHSMPSGAPANLCTLIGAGNQLSSNASACSTGVESFLLAYERIKNGMAKRVVAGASEAYSPWCWSPFDAMRVITRNYNENPEQGSRPMSDDSSGFVPAAGAGVLVLESLDSALERNAKIYAEICGGFINSGGQRNGGTMTAPSSDGVVRCIKGALENSKIDTSEIDLISGHLSSTMADPLEIENWTIALNRKKGDFPYINSTKSLIGHTIGAAGALETIAAILEMHNSFIHPSINCENLHPEIKNFIDEKAVARSLIENIELNCVAKAGFGFGDVNACLILKKYRYE